MAGKDDREPAMVRPLPTADVSPRRLSSSESTKQLTTALRLARKEFGKVAKDKQNTFQKNWYATLHSVLAAVDDALAGHGLLIIHSTRWEGGELWLDTTLEHESGEWIASVYPLFASNYSDPQRVGSCLTYARRYVVLSMLGIAPEDDDGVSAMDRGNGRQERQAPRREERRPDPPAPDRQSVARNAGNFSGPANELDAPRTPDVEPWATYIAKTLREEGDSWRNEMAMEGVAPEQRREYHETANVHQVVNHLATRLIELGKIEPSSIGKDGSTAVRDSALTRDAVIATYKRSPNSIRKAVAKYLATKRSEARAALGMPDFDDDGEVIEREPAISVPGDGPEDAPIDVEAEEAMSN